MAFVLPAAIQFQTTVAIATRLDGQLVLQSQNYGETVELTLADWPWKACNHGSDYVIQHRPLPEGVAPAICSSMARHDLPRFGQLMYASHATDKNKRPIVLRFRRLIGPAQKIDWVDGTRRPSRVLP